MPKKIAIIGTGYVGLTTGICLASLGHKVICVDKNEQKLGLLNKGEIPIYEPGLKKILEDNSERIQFTNNLDEAVKNSEVVIIAVGTPSNEGGSVDMSAFEGAVREIAKSMNGYKVIVNKSTVPVGAGDWVKNAIGEYYKGEFSVVSNPEFLSEGLAVSGFLNPDRIILGVSDKKSEEIMKDLYSSINAPKMAVSVRSAEMIKYAANAFLATKISFINEISNICERVGADVKEVSKGIGKDKRIGESFLKAGIGFGGSCFPKDIAGLRNISENNNYKFKLLEAVERVNEDQQDFFVQKIKDVLKEIGGKKICVLGLAFKPNTDDIRKSPAISIINKLVNEGFEISAYDPVAINNAKAEFVSGNVVVCDSLVEAATGADVLALMTEWPEFADINFDELKKVTRNNFLIDGRNFFNPQLVRDKGFRYLGMGRTTVNN